jgi:hypothetical protein
MNERPFTIALPTVADAKLPEVYAAARAAIQKCVVIDECKDWADRMAALASYAKQAEDEQLLKDCQRIRARAILRCGQLLKEIEVKHGANQNIGGDASPKVLTRKDAAEEAGLSPDQAKDAIRVANVPAEEFERQVESDNPPTVTELARQGTKQQQWIDEVLGGADPEDFKIATALAGHLSFAADELAQAAKLDLESAHRGMDEREYEFCLTRADAARLDLARIFAALEGDHATR